MTPSPRRYLILIIVTLLTAMMVAPSAPAVAQPDDEIDQVKAAIKALEKEQFGEKKKAQEKGVIQQIGGIRFGLVAGVILIGGGLLVRRRICLQPTVEADSSFVHVVHDLVLHPVTFFRVLPKRGDFVTPLLFALICIEISAVLGWLLVLIGVGQNPGLNPNPQTLGLPSVFVPTIPFLSLVLAPIGGAIGIFAAAAIQQLLVRLIIGARNSGFRATFRVASYTQVTNLVNWIPVVGPLIALYGIYLSIVGIREMHGTTTGKAVLVILLPFSVVLLIVLVILLTMGVMFFNQG